MSAGSVFLFVSFSLFSSGGSVFFFVCVVVVDVVFVVSILGEWGGGSAYCCIAIVT